MLKKVLPSYIVLTSDETRLVLNQFFPAWVTFTRHVSCWPEVNNEEKKRTRDFLRLGRQIVGQHGAAINKNKNKLGSKDWLPRNSREVKGNPYRDKISYN